MKTTVLIIFFLFAVSLTNGQSINEENPQKERSAIGIEFFDGLTYKRYLGKFSYEYNLGVQWGGFYDWIPTLQFQFLYQPFQKNVFQPYIGAGVFTSLGRKSDNLQDLYLKPVDRSLQFGIGAGAKVGFDIIPHSSRISYTFDLGLGIAKNPFSEEKPFQTANLGVGIRYHLK